MGYVHQRFQYFSRSLPSTETQLSLSLIRLLVPNLPAIFIILCLFPKQVSVPSVDYQAEQCTVVNKLPQLTEHLTRITDRSDYHTFAVLKYPRYLSHGSSDQCYYILRQPFPLIIIQPNEAIFATSCPHFFGIIIVSLLHGLPVISLPLFFKRWIFLFPERSTSELVIHRAPWDTYHRIPPQVLISHMWPRKAEACIRSHTLANPSTGGLNQIDGNRSSKPSTRQCSACEDGYS